MNDHVRRSRRTVHYHHVSQPLHNTYRCMPTGLPKRQYAAEHCRLHHISPRSFTNVSITAIIILLTHWLSATGYVILSILNTTYWPDYIERRLNWSLPYRRQLVIAIISPELREGAVTRRSLHGLKPASFIIATNTSFSTAYATSATIITLHFPSFDIEITRVYANITT